MPTTKVRQPSLWKRTVVEGLTIVLSILLAFSIDAMWANRIQKQELSASLAALQTDFQAIVVELDRALSAHSSRLEAANTLAQANESTLEAMSSDSVTTLLRRTLYTTTIDAQTATLYGMISGGQLANISDFNLRNDLARWEQLFRDHVTTQEMLANVIVNDYGPWLNSKTYLNRIQESPPRFEPALFLLFADFEFHNRVETVAGRTGRGINEIIELRERAVQLIVDISDELGGTV